MQIVEQEEKELDQFLKEHKDDTSSDEEEELKKKVIPKPPATHEHPKAE